MYIPQGKLETLWEEYEKKAITIARFMPDSSIFIGETPEYVDLQR